MTDFLTIDDDPYDVVADSAHEREPEVVGTKMLRTFSGRARSTARAEFRNMECTIGPLTEAELVTLKAAVDASYVHDVGGAWIGAAEIRAVILWRGATPTVADRGTGIRHFAQIEVRQVTDDE